MNEHKHQVIFIRGGEAFDTKEQFYDYLKNVEYDPYEKKRNRRDWLERSLCENFDSFAPLMPNKQSADYFAWKIRFERLFPYIKKDKTIKLILIWQSLGWLFLAKYLSENKFPKKVDQLHLVSPVFDNQGLTWETAGNFKINTNKLKNIVPQAKQIFIYHSTDDSCVPLQHSKKYLQYLPKAKFFQFKNRWHFNQPAFMEILQVINENM